jgi:hypothetical protein
MHACTSVHALMNDRKCGDVKGNKSISITNIGEGRGEEKVNRGCAACVFVTFGVLYQFFSSLSSSLSSSSSSSDQWGWR